LVLLTPQASYKSQIELFLFVDGCISEYIDLYTNIDHLQATHLIFILFLVKTEGRVFVVSQAFPQGNQGVSKIKVTALELKQSKK
jgi:hypothetical protein